MAEIEAKFLIRRPAQEQELLTTIGGLGYEIAAGETRSHVDTYFDTSDFAILQAGWTFRCRQFDDESVLTLKSSVRPLDAVFVREELEQPLNASGRPDKGKLPAGPVQRELEGIIGRKRRRALFEVRSRRKAYTITPPGESATTIELDLDHTRIVAARPTKKAPGQFSFTELELELLEGDGAAISDLARSLRQRLRLVPSQFSKFERGMLAAGISTATDGGEARGPQLKRNDPFSALLHWYLEQQFDALNQHLPVAKEGLDPEGVHQMRVAIRRIRAMLHAFADVFDSEPRGMLDNGLRELAKQLGPARDADVCEEQIERFNAVLSPEAMRDAAPYADHLRATTYDAYANLNEFLAGEQYAELVASLEHFISTASHAAAMRPYRTMTIARCADIFVRRTAAKMIKRGDRIDAGSSDRKVHKLRIQAKRFRYLLDFFSVVQKKKWRAVIAELENLQEMLGDHQDAVTARARLRDFVASLPEAAANRGLLLAMGRLLQVEEERMADHRRRLPEAWSRFKHCFEQSQSGS